MMRSGLGGFTCLLLVTSLFLAEGKATNAHGVNVVNEGNWKQDPQNNLEKLNESYFRLRVLSSRNRFHIFVNSEKKIIWETEMSLKNETKNSTNGLYFTAFNPRSGRIVMERMFATEVYAETIGIPAVLNSLRSGEIVVLAVKYDGALNLSRDIRRLLLSLGMSTASRVTYRNCLVWIFVSGGKTLLESVIDDEPSSYGDLSSSPVLVDILIQKDDKKSCWKESKNMKTQKREEFCQKYGGYGTLCSCSAPLNLNFNPPEIEGSFIKDVPLLIIAKSRPQLLFKCLLNILTQPGGHKSNIIVAIDGVHIEVQDLLNLLEITYTVHNATKQRLRNDGVQIGNTYRFAMNTAFNVFPLSDYVIIIEEDILLTPDAISFFNQVAPLLASDPSLYCINAWNDLSAMHTGGSPYRVMRTETLPAYGWMTTRKFITKISWPGEKRYYDWDVWFRAPVNRATRECLIPEISRSFHAGESGVHIKGQMTYAHITGHLTTGRQNIRLQNVDRLTQAEYEEDLHDLLGSDEIVFLETNLHPCHSKFIPRKKLKKTIVIFIWMLGLDDRNAWFRLASCLGVFNMDTRDHHLGLFKFFFYETRILVIGYPCSEYSYIKPSFIKPLSPIVTGWGASNKGLSYMSLMNRIRFRVPRMEERLPHSLLLDFPVPKPLITYVYPNSTTVIEKKAN